MGFVVESRHLGDIAVIVPKPYRDERGFFMEVYRADQFRELGIPDKFVQDNHSFSRKGVLRGLHFQWEPPMGKLMRVSRGTAFLVAVDTEAKRIDMTLPEGLVEVNRATGNGAKSEDQKR